MKTMIMINRIHYIKRCCNGLKRRWPEHLPKQYVQTELDIFEKSKILIEIGDCIWWTNRILIPHSLREGYLYLLHEYHWEMRKMIATAKDSV